MKHAFAIIAVFALLIASNPHRALAQVPARIAYQGVVLNQGQSVADGDYRITFRLYTEQQGGQPLWRETQTVPIQDGLLSTMMGAENALNLPFDKPYFLSIEVEGQPESQRMALATAPYALVARDVPDSTVVRSISGLQDQVEIVAGDGIAIQQRDNQLVISASGLQGYGPADTPITDQDVKHPAKNPTSLSEKEDFERLEELMATLGPGGSNTGLDLAYDGGRIITLDDGQVLLNGPGSGVGFQVKDADMLFRNSTGTNAAFRFQVDGVSTTQTWRAEVVGATGAFRVLNATSGNARPFTIDKTAATNLMVLEGSTLQLRDASGTAKVTIDTDVSGDGRVITEELEITGGSDLSEQFDITPGYGVAEAEPGMVVSIDPDHPGQLTVSGRAYDRMVAGVVSGAGGIETGLLMGQRGSEADGAVPVALTGRVYVWVDAEYGSVSPGDLLTSSATPGHAMKARDEVKRQGAILGKAMTALPSGKGLVLMLVSLQ